MSLCVLLVFHLTTTGVLEGILLSVRDPVGRLNGFFIKPLFSMCGVVWKCARLSERCTRAITVELEVINGLLALLEYIVCGYVCILHFFNCFFFFSLHVVQAMMRKVTFALSCRHWYVAHC